MDAAICANAVLGFGEPISCGMGGDCFVLLWDPKSRKVLGLNGSGRSPKGLSLAEQRKRANAKGLINSFGAVSVSVPGAVDAWWTLHGKFGKLPWKDLFQPAIRHAEEGAPIVQNVAYYVGASQRTFNKPESHIEEVANFNRIWVKDGKTPREGEIFRNPELAQTYRLVARGRRAGLLRRRDRRADRALLPADRRLDDQGRPSPPTTPNGSSRARSNYRGTDVWGLPPNSQGLVTLQLLNLMEQFDIKGMGFQSAAAIHHSVEAKRLAFEDRAKFYADPAF